MLLSNEPCQQCGVPNLESGQRAALQSVPPTSRFLYLKELAGKHISCELLTLHHLKHDKKKITRIEQAAQVNPGNQLSNYHYSFILEYRNTLSVIFILRVKEHPVIPSEDIMLLRINLMKRL